MSHVPAVSAIARRVGSFAAASLPVAAQAQTKIITGMVAHGPPQWPQYIATELGWLKQDNIELDFVTVGAGGAQQLAAGALNIAHSGYPDFARAALQGARGEDHHQRHRGVAVCGFRQAGHQADRRPQGQVDEHRRQQRHHAHLHQAVPGLGRIEDERRRFRLRQGGGRPLLRAGRGRRRRHHPEPPPISRRPRSGFSNLGDTKPYAEDIPFTVWAANMPWAAKNRGALVAFARNYKRGVRWLYDPANKAAGDRNPGEVRQAGPQGFARGLRYLRRQVETVRSRRRRVGQGL